MNIQIRKAEINDFAAVDSLLNLVHHLHYENRPDVYKKVNHAYSEEDFEELINNDNMIALLAEVDSIAVGLCIVTFRAPIISVLMTPRDVLYIEALSVKPEYRNCGIGKQLYLEVEKSAKEQGIKSIELKVWSFNETALRFYEEMGLKPQSIILEKTL